MKTNEIGLNNNKRTTYPMDWDTVISLESRLLREFKDNMGKRKGMELMMVSVGVRLGLRIIDTLSLRWCDLVDLEVGEKFVRLEQKTQKNRILVMSSKLKEIVDFVYTNLNPNKNHFIFTSQKGKGKEPICIQTFNRKLKELIKSKKVKCIGNVSSHLLRKSFVVGSIKKGFENGDYLSLVKVSRLINHNSVSTTIKYTNFETNQMLDLYELS